MKNMTLEAFSDFLDQDLSWREKELFYLKNRAIGCKSVAQKTLIRSGITLAYAHWEGFVKKSSNKYLSYVFSQKKSFEELQDNFYGILICKELSKYQDSKRQYLYTEFSYNNISKYKLKPDFDPENFIDTQANLTPKLFQEILLILGIQEKLFETKEKFINERVLKNRHEIAHGTRNDNFSIDDLEEISSEVIKMLEEYKEIILDYAINKKYLKPFDSPNS